MNFRRLASSASSASSIVVSRIVTNGGFKQPPRQRPTFVRRARSETDAYDICIKARAIAQRSGATPSLAFGLNQLSSRKLPTSSRPVLLNTILTALSRERQSDQFWQVFRAKVANHPQAWSPELVATLLNEVAHQLQASDGPKDKSADNRADNHTDNHTDNHPDSGTDNHTDNSSGNEISARTDTDKSTMERALWIYTEALKTLPVATSTTSHIHMHNALLKCISRAPNVSLLLWILERLSLGKVSTASLSIHGIAPFLTVSDAALALCRVLDERIKRPVPFDCHSLSSILATLARAPEGTIALAETLWRIFSETLGVTPDRQCHLALLLVYRNDLSRLLRTRRLVRAQSWRERKLQRVEELVKTAGVTLHRDSKFLSIYYEICMNANLNERVVEHFDREITTQRIRITDERVLECVRRARRATNTRKERSAAA